MENYIEDYKAYIDTAFLKEKAGSRKIFIWGACKKGEDLAAFLKANNFSIYGYIDSDTNKVGASYKGLEVYPKDILKNNVREYYTIIPLEYHEVITDYLSTIDFQIFSDYFYCQHAPIEITRCDYYKDIWGNEIIGKVKGFKVVFKGRNGKLILGKNLNIHNDAVFRVHDNALIVVGDHCIVDKVLFESMKNAYIKIGDSCLLGNNGIFLSYSKLDIGNNFTYTYDFKCFAEPNSPIIIGNDCMFSNDVQLWSDNSHEIFDLKNKKNMNAGNKSIIIGDHVWLGLRVTVLYYSNIGSGSIVGADSLTKRTFPENAMIAGAPACVIKENVGWSRKKCLSYEDFEEECTSNHYYDLKTE